jgi:hypothetical protein
VLDDPLSTGASYLRDSNSLSFETGLEGSLNQWLSISTLLILAEMRSWRVLPAMTESNWQHDDFQFYQLSRGINELQKITAISGWFSRSIFGKPLNKKVRERKSALGWHSYSDLPGGSKWLNFSRKGIPRERKKRSQAESTSRLRIRPSDRLARLRTILLLLALSTY